MGLENSILAFGCLSCWNRDCRKQSAGFLPLLIFRIVSGGHSVYKPNDDTSESSLGSENYALHVWGKGRCRSQIAGSVFHVIGSNRDSTPMMVKAAWNPAMGVWVVLDLQSLGLLGAQRVASLLCCFMPQQQFRGGQRPFLRKTHHYHAKSQREVLPLSSPQLSKATKAWAFHNFVCLSPGAERGGEWISCRRNICRKKATLR